jgi:hypothetical protein
MGRAVEDAAAADKSSPKGALLATRGANDVARRDARSRSITFREDEAAIDRISGVDAKQRAITTTEMKNGIERSEGENE